MSAIDWRAWGSVAQDPGDDRPRGAKRSPGGLYPDARRRRFTMIPEAEGGHPSERIEPPWNGSQTLSARTGEPHVRDNPIAAGDTRYGNPIRGSGCLLSPGHLASLLGPHGRPCTRLARRIRPEHACALCCRGTKAGPFPTAQPAGDDRSGLWKLALLVLAENGQIGFLLVQQGVVLDDRRVAAFPPQE